MRKSNWIAGTAVVFLLLLVALTLDPLGFFSVEDDRPAEETLDGGALESAGLRGRGDRSLPDADPASWDGDPVGRLELSLGAATLRGTVTGEGQPLRFARVRAVLPPPQDALAVRTRKDGTWEVAGLPDGQHEVRAAAEGFGGRTAVAPAVKGEDVATVETIDLERVAANRNAIVVRVTDAFGRPIPGAKVLATTAPWNLHLAMGPEVAGIPGVQHRQGVTDENGRVRLAPLVPDEYGVVAFASGYVSAAVERLAVAAGRTQTVSLHLLEGVAVRGRVLDRDGAGIAGATVMGFAQPSFVSSLTATTEADGSFVLDGLRKGGYMFVGWSMEHGSVMVPGSAPGTIEITLKGVGHVQGRAVWEDGRPVTRGQVRPFKVGPFEYVYSMVFPLHEDGRFEFDVPEGDWNCRVQAAEGYVADGTIAHVTVGETTTVEVKVAKSAVVRGVVMDEQGHHVAGAEVFVMQGGFPESPSREQYARSDADGRFEVPGLVAGATVDLHVQHGDYADTKIRVTPQTAGSAKEVSVRLSAGAVLVGHVREADGAGVPGEQVNLAAGWFDARSTFTDGEGHYRFEAVSPGTYMVTTGPFEQGARGLMRSGIEVGEGGAVTVDFENAKAAGKLAGTVTQGGAPLAGAQVTVTDARGPERALVTRTDEAGRFAVEGVQFGSVRVDARSSAGLTASAHLLLTDGGEAPDVALDIGTSRVRARILDAAGEPAAGCWINLESADDGEEGWGRVKHSGNADTVGVYVSGALHPGRYVLRVNRVESAQYLSPPFDVAQNQVRDLGDIRLQAGVVLQGTARDDSGAPVEKATVSLRDEQGRKVQLFSMATTGSDGRYAMQSVEPGRYSVLFEAKGHAPHEAAVEVTDSGAVADAVLTRGGRVVVAVRDPGGAPVPGARVRLVDAQGREVTRTISLVNFDSGSRYTDGQGETSLADLASGTYLVRCELEGWTAVGGEPRVRIEPGGTATAQVVLEKAP